MGRDIEIEATEDRKSWFNLKYYRIGDTRFSRPEKTLDVKEMNNATYRSALLDSHFNLAEVSKKISSPTTLEALYTQADDARINDFFSRRHWLGGAPLILNYTLGFNPVPHLKDGGALMAFLDIYHQHSNFILTVPNIRMHKFSSDPNRPKERIVIATIEDYKTAISAMHDRLSEKNHKPVFVPLSLRMSMRDLDALLDHYLKHDYLYYWFDFEGRSINVNALARLRHFFIRLKSKGWYDRSLAYFTNVRREVLANSKQELSAASDVLASLAGANIVGVNQEPLRIPRGDPKPVPPDHKARILHPDTYYYVKSKDPRMFPRMNYTTQNAIELNNEFLAQTEFFLKHGEIEHLAASKRMLVEFSQGDILKGLMTKREEESGGMMQF